jgi:hypothetical protein
MIKKLILIPWLTVLLSCDSVMPGGIWDKFETELRIEKQSDQGPWGGKRSYYWRSETTGYFNKEKIFDFTSSNGWSLVDSVKCPEEESRNLKKNNRPGFTIQVGPFETNASSEVFLEEDFPRWINTGLTLYRFKTGIVIFYPGTDSYTEVNGFITVSENEKEMTVYHLWGE